MFRVDSTGRSPSATRGSGYASIQMPRRRVISISSPTSSRASRIAVASGCSAGSQNPPGMSQLSRHGSFARFTRRTASSWTMRAEALGLGFSQSGSWHAGQLVGGNYLSAWPQCIQNIARDPTEARSSVLRGRILDDFRAADVCGASRLWRDINTYSFHAFDFAYLRWLTLSMRGISK